MTEDEYKDLRIESQNFTGLEEVVEESNQVKDVQEKSNQIITSQFDGWTLLECQGEQCGGRCLY